MRTDVGLFTRNLPATSNSDTNKTVLIRSLRFVTSSVTKKTSIIESLKHGVKLKIISKRKINKREERDRERKTGGPPSSFVGCRN